MVGKSVAENYLEIKKNVAEALIRSGKSNRNVQVVAISKRQEVKKIQECLDAGIFDIGENYLQEAQSKMNLLKNSNIHWHFVGTVQSKKVKSMLGLFYLWHGVDRVSVIEELHKRKNNQNQKILLQINIANEDSKSGIPKEKVKEFIEEIKDKSGFSICGLMAMPPIVTSEEETKSYFREMNRILLDCQNYVNTQIHPMNQLSMGTSHDYTLAIEEGATIIRVGESLLGPRE